MSNDNIEVVRKRLGAVTAYRYAVTQGYTGTEQEFAALMASYATVAEEAEAAKDDAVDAKTAAEEAQAAAEAAAEQAEGAIEVDDTLSVEGRAADAAEAGKRIDDNNRIILDLTQYKNDEFNVQDWGKYYIQSSGAISSSSNTVLARNITVEYPATEITVADGYQVKIGKYRATPFTASNFVSVSDYYSGNFSVRLDPEYYYAFQVKKDDSSAIDLEELPENLLTYKNGYMPDFSKFVASKKEIRKSDAYKFIGAYINSSDMVASTAISEAAVFFHVTKGFYDITANENTDTIIAVLTSDFDRTQIGSRPSFMSGYPGRITIPAGTTYRLFIPFKCVLYVYNKTQAGVVYFPAKIIANLTTDCNLDTLGMPADAKTVREFVRPAVESLVPAFNFHNDDLSSYGSIEEDGSEIVDSTNRITEFIKIPVKYKKNLLYTHLVIDGEYGGVVAFYNESYEFIELVEVNSYITNDDSYVYARAVVPINASNVMFTFSNENTKPAYKMQKTNNLGINNWFGYGKNGVSDGCMTAMIKTALAYAYDEQYGYGTEHTAFGEECIKTTKDTHTSSSGYEGERYQVDCSTYVMLIIQGILPECSRYFYTKNVPADYGYKFNALAEYEGYVYGVPQTLNTKRLYANSIAEYALKNGFLYAVDDDLGNVKPGDILFVSNQGASYKFFENIGHCMFVYNTIALEDGGNAIETFEGNGGAGSPCKRHTYTSKNDTWKYGARFPFAYVKDTAKNIAVFSEEITESVSGTEGENVNLADISLSEPLKNGNVYTAVIDADFVENGYYKVSIANKSYNGYASSDVLKRPDGKTIIRFVVFNTDELTNPNEISIQLACTGTVNENITIKDFKLFDGFVTPSVI